jgi:hypothetical protein
MTPPLDLDLLEAVAKAATPGPWTWRKYSVAGPDEQCIIDDPSSDQGIRQSEDKEYICAFSPTTALALMARVRKLLDEVERLDHLARGQEALRRSAQFDLTTALARAEKAERERDALQARLLLAKGER